METNSVWKLLEGEVVVVVVVIFERDRVPQRLTLEGKRVRGALGGGREVPLEAECVRGDATRTPTGEFGGDAAQGGGGAVGHVLQHRQHLQEEEKVVVRGAGGCDGGEEGGGGREWQEAGSKIE